MSTTELMEMINKLPVDKQKEVESFVSGLLSEDTDILGGNARKRMKFGDLKGFVKYIADDFDEPLEDFKDYM
ncbi:MAG TPA: DUF2281 domain-containing protein [Mucilaginibacter sp.]|jgi:hypothetical protein